MLRRHLGKAHKMGQDRSLLSIEPRLQLGILHKTLEFKEIMKEIVIWIVRIYQKTASDRLRRSCRFEPTCSEYMIKAIEKYGVFKGIILGVKRLLRCRPPNGGIDYP
jgi:putative membrane protein insertion efficiency factor